MNRIGVDVKGQFPLPDTYGISIPSDWRRMVHNVILYEGYTDGPWMYKDSRSALIWPVWHRAFPKAKWVIVRRRTGDIIQSCVKTGFMIAFKDGANWDKTNSDSEISAWIWYVRQYERKFVEMIDAGLDYRILWPERMVTKDYQQLYDLLEWLGLDWNPEALDIINTLLWGDATIERRKAV
jgi:hypothetical protein